MEIIGCNFRFQQQGFAENDMHHQDVSDNISFAAKQQEKSISCKTPDTKKEIGIRLRQKRITAATLSPPLRQPNLRIQHSVCTSICCG